MVTQALVKIVQRFSKEQSPDLIWHLEETTYIRGLCEDSVSKQRNEMSFSTGCMRREPTATYELKMSSGKEQCFAILIKNAGEMRG